VTDLCEASHNVATHKENFEKTDLKKADLRNADLVGANLIEAYLNGADLENAHFEGSDLDWAILIGANLTTCHLAGAEPRPAQRAVKKGTRQGFRMPGRGRQRRGRGHLWRIPLRRRPGRALFARSVSRHWHRRRIGL